MQQQQAARDNIKECDNINARDNVKTGNKAKACDDAEAFDKSRGGLRLPHDRATRSGASTPIDAMRCAAIRDGVMCRETTRTSQKKTPRVGTRGFFLFRRRENIGDR